MRGQLVELKQQRVTCANCGRNYKNEKEYKRHIHRNRCRGQFGLMPVVPTLPASPSGAPTLGASPSVLPSLAPLPQSDLVGQGDPADLENNLE